MLMYYLIHNINLMLTLFVCMDSNVCGEQPRSQSMSLVENCGVITQVANAI